ncbi:MAG: indolepyruvate ferredoxin oxidoreductase subunit alpha [Synergistaceae bacterium]|nr:indolepyruvate ferredoxin oxidoreductase subunit alpha [Synergistaceae bacterium]
MKQLLSGNEAAARGAWEAGLAYASAYPGTPSTEILENLSDYKEVTAEWAPNEKAALESAIGASIGGVRALAAMKHVGVNVAADPMFTFAYMGVNGGMVLISADDPGMHSSQNEQDNRHYARFAKIPMLEPSDSQECLEMMKEAFVISETYDTMVLYRMTTRVCHSRSLVVTGDRLTANPPAYRREREKYDAVPAISRILRVKLEGRIDRLRTYSENCAFNRIEDNGSQTGVITSGISYCYAKEIFGDSVSYLKLGFTHPLPMNLIRNFAGKVSTLYVIEELEPFIEEQIRTAGIACVGKDKLPAMGEFDPDTVARSLLGRENPTIAFDKALLVDRPPTLCAGCPHRPFFYELGKRKNTIICGDIGCYGLGGSAPLNAKDLCICMGSSFSVAHGMARAVETRRDERRTVAVMGDSTFFHTGINSLINILYNHSNVIAVILDNRVTAMTGHQENPGTGHKLQGEVSDVMDIGTIARALGAKHVRQVNPMRLDEMRSAIDWAYGIQGEPVVLITRWPCIFKKLSDEEKREFPQEQRGCAVNEGKCIGCKLCVRTGCPALSYEAADKKARVDAVQCTGCGVCVQVCPKQAIA